jgi:hypothetical protein
MKKPLTKNNKIETKSLVIPKCSSRRGSTKSSRSSLSSFRRSKVVAAVPPPNFKGQAFLTPTYEDPRKAIEEFRSITPIMEITDTEEHCEINQMWQVSKFRQQRGYDLLILCVPSIFQNSWSITRDAQVSKNDNSCYRPETCEF